MKRRIGKIVIKIILNSKKSPIIKNKRARHARNPASTEKLLRL
jgi:hypothetical protein